MTTGLVIGRFQPFHKGHIHAIEYVRKNVDKIIIGVGSALDSHTLNNPFTAAERIEMILIAIKEMGWTLSDFLIIPIPDAPYHKEWVSIVESIVPHFDVVYSNDPLTKILFMEEGYTVKDIPLLEREHYSGEEFRKRVIEGENWREIVTEKVAKYLEEHGLIKRLIELTKTDKPFQKEI
jgi:nicotinamide-nucleotide adenylyltransferase